ncbi:glycoside hydrolase [Dendrothele bispora CBS 962.96]|uniref:Glycoside hydrolase n=1 Tax=Dendrothele bispora (strain CBS 962.96) TaxID=1314807 RepID=A0A4S8MLU5_DENBC|nr:glycoside hydrolase [Dendrothele bispora CBS 962.96]THV03722.1 glycoside hydrolase [Dendrothele bispora CBS 962.96]
MQVRYASFLILLIFCNLAKTQQIWDIWQTTWDRSKLFTSLALTTPINFVATSTSTDASINIVDTTTFQDIAGFGGSLTDSAAKTLNKLKSTNSANYWSLLNYAFNMADGANAAGLSYIRVPIGATDFSDTVYSLDTSAGDTSLSKFNMNNSPSYLYSVLKDILSVNPHIKVHLLPWSPPGWMKDSGTMNGGSLNSNMMGIYPTYLFKAVQGFQAMGIPVFAIGIQNEPENSDPTYPSCSMPPEVEGQLGASLRSLLNQNGLGSIKIIGYEHNWNDAGSYPVTLLNDNPNAFAGVSFHCYGGGNVANQDAFHNAYPNKEIYFTECTGTIGSDWWSDIKWYMTNLWIGSLQHNSKSGLMWNLALDGDGLPVLPGSDSCTGQCRPMVTVNGDGSYAWNQEFLSMAQASKAIIPKDSGGPFGTRIGVNVAGAKASTLVVGAYVTRRNNPSDWSRYSVVVLNANDGSAQGGWNPQPVEASINFRGMHAIYTFPVGVTTLWWYAPSTSTSKRYAPTMNNTLLFNSSTNTSEIVVPGKKPHPYPRERRTEAKLRAGPVEAHMNGANLTLGPQTTAAKDMVKVINKTTNITANTRLNTTITNMSSNKTEDSTRSSSSQKHNSDGSILPSQTSLEGTSNVTSV